MQRVVIGALTKFLFHLYFKQRLFLKQSMTNPIQTILSFHKNDKKICNQTIEWSSHYQTRYAGIKSRTRPSFFILFLFLAYFSLIFFKLMFWLSIAGHCLFMSCDHLLCKKKWGDYTDWTEKRSLMMINRKEFHHFTGF